MSAKSKTARAIKRKSEKRARKAQQKARYAAYAAAGNNQKSKRKQKKKARPHVKVVKHANDCTNVGCEKCSPVARLRLWKPKVVQP